MVYFHYDVTSKMTQLLQLKLTELNPNIDMIL